MQIHVQPFCCGGRARGLAATTVSLVIRYSWVRDFSEFVFSATTHCCTVHSDPLDLPHKPQRTTGCWCCDISHPPCHVACITVQLITVSKCRVRPSLYSRWLRPEPTRPSDRDQACTWSQVIATYPRRTDQLIAIKCWSRQEYIHVSLFSFCIFYICSQLPMLTGKCVKVLEFCESEKWKQCVLCVL